MEYISVIVVLFSICFIIFLGYKKNVFSIPKNFSDKLLLFCLSTTLILSWGTLLNTRMIQEEIPIAKKDSIFVNDGNISLFLETLDGKIAQKDIDYNSNFEFEIYEDEIIKPFLEVKKQQRMFIFTDIVERTHNQIGWKNISEKYGKNMGYILHIDEKTFDEINKKREDVAKNESN